MELSFEAWKSRAPRGGVLKATAMWLLLLATIGLSSGVQAAVLIAQYHMEETTWSGAAGELKDTAGFASGPFNGQALGSAMPLPVISAPARVGDPGTCGYASMPGPASNGGAFSIPNLPVSLASGAKTSVAFWMYWDGSDSVMPIGWKRHDLWLIDGSFGFNTGNSDLFGVSSAGLANGWHHVVAVFTNGSVSGNQLYIDGVVQTLTQQRRNAPSNASASVSTTLRISGWQTDSRYRFSGRIDEVNVYNGAVSAAEVAGLYSQTHPCPVPPKKPIAEWRFDELTGNSAFDSSGNGYHATGIGDVSVGSSGRICSSYTYNGGYVSLPAAFPDHTAGVTITGWFRPADVSTPGQRIFADDEHNSGGYAVSLGDGGSGRVRFFSRGPRPVSLDSSAVVTPDAWYFVAAVADTSAKTKQLLIYDAFGNLLDSKTQSWSGTWGSDAGVPSIGGETDSSAESRFRFKGEIDELMVFDVALTSAEISTGYAHQNAGRNWDGSARSCPVLIAEYHMDESGWNGTPGELKDSAGYVGGPFNGQAIGNPLPSSSVADPALPGNPGSCDYAGMPGPPSNGGAFSISNLPVSLAAGAQTSVAFWMYWDGTNSTMPIGWNRHDLWLVDGHFGFNTSNSDVFGISSTGLENGWHHVVAVFNNGSITRNRLYIDAVDQPLTQRRRTPNISAATVSSTLRIGGWRSSNGYRFRGRIDEVKVYNGAVNQALVNSLYSETHPCHFTPPVLTGLWRSDESKWDGTAGEVIDASGFGHHGTALNGVSTRRSSPARSGDPGTCGYGRYDGNDDYVVVPHSNNLNGESFTVALWARVDGGTGSWRSPLTSRGSSGSDRYGYNLYAGTNNRWQFWTARGGSAGNGWEILDGPPVSGAWTHVVATFQKGSGIGSGALRGIKKLYINGSLVAIDNNAVYRPMNGGYQAALTLGAGGVNGSQHRFNGAVDEVRVYDGAVDASVVTALYNETHPCPPDSDAFAFNCVEPGADPLTGRLFTQRVGEAITLEVIALKDGDGDGNADAVETDFANSADRNVTVELVDTSSAGSCAAYPTLLPAASQGLLFSSADAGRKVAIPFTLNKAYRSLGCRVTDSTGATPVVGCSTDQFAVRPLDITLIVPLLDNASSSGTPSAVAGNVFSLQADTVAGYDGTPLIDNDKLQAHPGAVAPGSLGGGFNAANPVSGTASGNAFTYSEVGNFRLLAEGVYDAAFTLVDQPDDCSNDFSNTRVAGKVGCKFGNRADTDWVGRFIPNDFVLNITSHGALQNSCVAGGFSYAGTAISYDPLLTPGATITARNSSGDTTRNYTGVYNKLPLSGINMPDVTSDGSQLGVDGVNRVGLNWSLGTPALVDNGDGTFDFTLSGDSFTYGRDANDRVAPFTSDLLLTVQEIMDDDAVAGSGMPQSFSPTGVEIRYGRMTMQNAQGSELQPLNIPLQAEYFAGAANGFVDNTDDFCTQGLQIRLVDIDSTDRLEATTAGNRNTAVYAPASVAGGYAAADLSDASLLYVEPPGLPDGGRFNLNLQAPGQGDTGSAQVLVEVPAWLKYSWSGSGMGDPSARATFGIFSRPDGLIYQRENR